MVAIERAARAVRRVTCQPQDDSPIGASPVNLKMTRPPAAAALALSGTQPRAGPVSHASKAQWGAARSALTPAPSELDAWRRCRRGEPTSTLLPVLLVLSERGGSVVGRAPRRDELPAWKNPMA